MIQIQRCQITQIQCHTYGCNAQEGGVAAKGWWATMYVEVCGSYYS